jgi:hypothetical protein
VRDDAAMVACWLELEEETTKCDPPIGQFSIAIGRSSSGPNACRPTHSFGLRTHIDVV